MGKKRVLFVGSFKNAGKDGSVGGQMYACKSLISSSLSETVEWILLDSTGDSVPPPPISKRLFLAFKRVIKFIYLIIKFRPQVTLIFSANGTSFLEKGMMVLIASIFSIKTILAPRGGPLEHEINKSRLFRSFAKLVLRRSSFVICQGNFWKAFFSSIERSNPQKYVSIPNWIDLDNYIYNDKRTITNIHRKDEEAVMILFMGWVQSDKGVFDLYSALSGESLKNKRLHIAILGDGPAREELMTSSKKQNNPKHTYEFPGWVHGISKANYLAKADIFILPSYSEGMPNSLMEAMASGIPSIATDVGGVKDLIGNNESGLVIKVGDIKGISNAILYYINETSETERIVQSARQVILNNHSLEIASKKMKTLIEN
ncbi:MAG: glycosyltransferase [Sediminibacterium sp. Gen4]|jgi:glycosyltransferase involved in cell wall biosynthesis|uniref:glycosyltransferase n=1 Tax=unclassified Sediminibacterium TaxID=2635961 RepID=UPI0015BC4CD0|nr:MULTISPECIES: glycosyltransferase [unclassified Sediminibacterium]MBW0163717.1 glycosyltransferase [Sediminibacterium sp.]NWK66933.1 glycosyltransferase [Sediminibacterium sp. Gen4]